MKKVITIIIACSCFLYYSLYTEPIISFFLRSYPDVAKDLKRIKKGKSVASAHSFDVMPFAGLYAIYGGMIQVSDAHGQITFLRKHTDEAIYLVVTTQIIPIVMFHNTIHHWEINPDISTTIYRIERDQDPQTKIFFWDVQLAAMPPDNVLPANAIVLFAKPTNVYVPLGVTPTNNLPHLFLPDIYIRKGVNPVKNALFVLTINQLFGNLESVYTKRPKAYSYRIKE